MQRKRTNQEVLELYGRPNRKTQHPKSKLIQNGSGKRKRGRPKTL